MADKPVQRAIEADGPKMPSTTGKSSPSYPGEPKSANTDPTLAGNGSGKPTQR